MLSFPSPDLRCVRMFQRLVLPLSSFTPGFAALLGSRRPTATSFPFMITVLLVFDWLLMLSVPSAPTLCAQQLDRLP